MFKVVYRVLSTGVDVTKTFASPYLCRKFVNRLKHSKKCSLISYPIV